MDPFSFKGRASRRDFWTIWIAMALLQALVVVLGGIVLSALREPVVGPEQRTLAVAIFSVVILIAFGWPLAAVGVRRSHDRNMSGGWFLISMAFSVATNIWDASISLRGVPEDAPEVVGLGIAGVLQLILSVVFLVTFGFLKGTPGPNRYGNPPGVRSGYHSTLGRDDLDRP
ncbi:MAG: DUF805 domain-containing protein [Brevundimonas sp.]|nr:DUF805 domain-containing protein [Brevundimonas sp.]